MHSSGGSASQPKKIWEMGVGEAILEYGLRGLSGWQPYASLPLGRFLLALEDLRLSGRQPPTSYPSPDSKAGHWIATGQFFENYDGKSYIKIWILKGGVQGPGRGGSPCTPPSRSRALYRIFHMDFPKKCPVVFQWPVTLPF